ncbi:MAG: tRNA lysidine(34) synthetase TilS [Bacteroidales bacterium]|nr:tRNA lysidine(34) synthetase TilS [Bacteroidales bacterium]
MIKTDFSRQFFRQFSQFVEKNFCFNKHDRILLAVSGGADSMVMASTFLEAGFSCGIAHCNFGLRGKESDLEEDFVRQFAKKNTIPFFIKRVDTKQMVIQSGISIQMAARTARYDFFEEILINHGFHFIATAHHQDDSLETFFVNFLRGSGIKGLIGIPVKNGRIVRPLLFARREAIERFAAENKIAYCNDSSNAKDDYLRNRIRHHIIPALNGLTENASESMLLSIKHLSEASEAIAALSERIRIECVCEEENGITINFQALKNTGSVSYWLFEIIREFGFNASQLSDILHSMNTQSGKVFYSASHELIRQRDSFLIRPKEQIKEDVYVISKEQQEIHRPVHCSFQWIQKTNPGEFIADNSIAFLDAQKLDFPLTIRRWREGDYFIPFGMRGKKKISDFYTSLKFNARDKENTWLLCSGGEIIWVVGYRIDNRYKITTHTKHIYQVILKDD